MKPSQALMGFVLLVGPCCVLQYLAAIKMAIRTEYETQKAAAIDAGVDQSQFTRKLRDAEPFTFRDLDRLSPEAQRVALLEMLAQIGLPARAKRWIKVARDLDGYKQRSA